ncbi:MAG: hypothetical protein K2G89_05630, partial [Lachnospiraceae bacterium]|nr:hypothetical protein [Lachnospiraceae bacterium]
LASAPPPPPPHRPAPPPSLVGEGFRDAYRVVEVVAEQWGESPEDFSQDTDRLAIYTCKKQKNRPKPYMVVRAKKAS